MKKILSLTILAVFFITLFNLECAKQKEEIKIGWIGVLSGDAAYYGMMVQKGTMLAVEEINRKGGIKGRKIKVIYEDDQLTPRLGVSALKKLINVDKVPVVIQAAGSSVMLAEAPIAEKNKVVLISPTVSNYKIKEAGDYVFRIWPSDAYQGKVLADFVKKSLKNTKVAVAAINNDYGIGLKDAFIDRFMKINGKVLQTEVFDPGSTDFHTIINKLKKIRPPVVFLASHYRESALFLKQAKEVEFNSIFIGGDGNFAPDLIKLSGGAAEGMYVSNLHWDPSSKKPIIANFVKSFKDTFHQEPEVYAAAGYDCLCVVAKAIEMGGYTSEGIKNALYKIKDFQGVTGTITFDKWGEVSGRYDIFQVRNGQFIKLKR
ncbi:MAG TPA: hypothetical protein ENK92_02405 [Bacteroidetes bacterium]|nr:hypothetical protein [Bacteroidota bacterium]